MSSWKNSSWCERATNQHIIALKTTVTQRVDTTVPVALAFLGRQTQTQSTWHRRESHFSDSLSDQHTKSAKSGCFPSLLFDTWRVLEDVSPIFTIIFRLKALEKYAVEISWGATGIYRLQFPFFFKTPDCYWVITRTTSDVGTSMLQPCVHWERKSSVCSGQKYKIKIQRTK